MAKNEWTRRQPAIRGGQCKYTHSFRGIVFEICERLAHVEPAQVARWLRTRRSPPNRLYWHWHFHRRGMYIRPEHQLAHEREDQYHHGIVETTLCCERCGANLTNFYSRNDCLIVKEGDDGRSAWVEGWFEAQIPPGSGEVRQYCDADGSPTHKVIAHRTRRFYEGVDSFVTMARHHFGTPCRGCGELTYRNDYWRRFPWNFYMREMDLCSPCARHLEKVDRREAKRIFGTIYDAQRAKTNWSFDKNMADYIIAAWAVEVAKGILREERKRRQHERETDGAADGRRDLQAAGHGDR